MALSCIWARAAAPIAREAISIALHHKASPGTIPARSMPTRCRGRWDGRQRSPRACWVLPYALSRADLWGLLPASSSKGDYRGALGRTTPLLSPLLASLRSARVLGGVYAVFLKAVGKDCRTGIAQQRLISNAARIESAKLTLLRDNFSRAMRRNQTTL